MNELNKQLEQIRQASKQRIPLETQKIMANETEALKDSGIIDNALQDGKRAYDFTLPNHLGEMVNLYSLLSSGPVVVSFYRGGW